MYNPFVFLELDSPSHWEREPSAPLKRLSFTAEPERLEPRSNLLINNAIHGFFEVVTFRATEAVNNYLADRKSFPI